MKIIGTGLSGLVGSRIVELLQGKFDFVDFSLDSGVDITDFRQLKSAFSRESAAKVVLHLAAFTNVDAAWQQNEDTKGSCYRVNVIGTENIAKICRETGSYLIHISTDFVFDGQNPPVGGYIEEDKPSPIEWYGKTKLWAEEKLKESSCKHLILRIAFPFKAKASQENLEPQVKLDLVRKIKHKLENGETVSVFADQLITPTFIDDLAMVVRQAINEQPQGLYHTVGSTSLSPFNLANQIARVFNLDEKLIQATSLVKFVKKNQRPRQKNMTLSNQKLERDFRFEMKTISKALQKIKQQLS